MEFNSPNLWLLAAMLFVVFEIMSMSLYMLVLAFGCLWALLGVFLEVTVPVQFAMCAGGSLFTFFCLRACQRLGFDPWHRGVEGSSCLDVGRVVHVGEWAPDGTAQVVYRDANWSARFGGEGLPQPGSHRIEAVEGLTLVLGVVSGGAVKVDER